MILKYMLILVLFALSFLFGCERINSNYDNNSKNVLHENSKEYDDNTENTTDENSKKYDTLGIYNIKRYPEQGLIDEYVVYAPEKDSISEDIPVVLFLAGGNAQVSSYSGIMQFLASKGYYVIGSNHSGSYNSYETYMVFRTAINAARRDYHLKVTKLVAMGHSQGGGQAFYVMKKLQGLELGFGSEASLVLSVDGWFAFTMNQSHLRSLKGDVAFLQMNGLAGTGTDPRIHLTIWNLADQTKRKFLILPENNHSYIAGSLNNLLNNKKDILYIIGALTDDLFTGNMEGYNSIPEANKSSYDAIYNALKPKNTYHSGDCYGNDYNARNGQLKYYDINYCTPEEYIPLSVND